MRSPVNSRSRPRESKDLFAPGIGDFRLGQLGGFVHAAIALDFHQFVNKIQMRRVTGSGQRGAHSKRIDLRAFLQQRGHVVFIEIAAGEDFHVGPARAIQFVANPFAVFDEIAAIQAHAGRLAAHGENFLQSGANIVGIEQQHGMIGKRIEEMAEGGGFIVVGHHPGMGLRAVGFHSEALAGEHIRSALAAADRSGASGEQAGLAAVSAARAEFDDRASLRGGDDAGGFAGNHRLEAHRGEEIRLHDLRFDDRRGHANQRLARQTRACLRAWPRLRR